MKKFLVIGIVMLFLASSFALAQSKDENVIQGYPLKGTMIQACAIEGNNTTLRSTLIDGYFRIWNEGNVTAFNVTWNCSVRGGLLNRNHDKAQGNLTELGPGQILNVKFGLPRFGFGIFFLHVYLGADNAEEFNFSMTFRMIFFKQIFPSV